MINRDNVGARFIVPNATDTNQNLENENKNPTNQDVINQNAINQGGGYQGLINQTPTAVLGEENNIQQQLIINQDLANQFIQIKGNLGTLGEIIQKDGQFYLAKNIIEGGNIKRHTIKKINLDSSSVNSRIIEDHSIGSEDLENNLTIKNLVVDGDFVALNYIGQTSITTLGTISSGTWQGSSINSNYLDSNVMLEGENISLLNNNAGYITASSSDTLTNKTWNGNIIGIAYGGTGTSNGSITGTGALNFSAGGTNQNITLTPSGSGNTILNGNVGIGTTSPGAKLDVNGDAKINGLTVGKGLSNGNTNTALGVSVLANTVGSSEYNSAVGYLSLTALTSGVYNTAIGGVAGSSITTGNNNVAVGTASLNALIGGSSNIAIGTGALRYGTGYSDNIAIGGMGGLSLSGGYNTSVGSASGNALTSGTFNTFLGYGAGTLITTGSYNVVIGSYYGADIATLSNQVVISDGQGNRRINIDNSGNIGIGTTSPNGTLQIAGASSNWSGSNYGKELLITAASALNHPAIGISDYMGTNWWAINNTAGVLKFASMPAITDGTTIPDVKMMINANGQVGIGATTPAYKFHIQQTDAFNSLAISPTTGTNAAGLILRNTGGNSYLFIDNSDGAYAGTGVAGAYATFLISGAGKPLYLGAGAGGVGIKILPTTGNVGIGNVAPLSKLGITGNASIGATYGAIAAPTSGMIIEGNVGIGIMSPASKLDIFAPDNVANVLHLSNTISSGGSGTYRGILIDGYQPNGASAYIGIQIAPLQALTSSMTGLDITYSASYNTTKGINIALSKNLDAATPGYGIVSSVISTGTTNNNELLAGDFKLSQTGGTSTDQQNVARFQNASVAGNAKFLTFGTEASYTERGTLYYDRTDNAFGVNGNNALSLSTGGTVRAFVSSSGNVGIGTTGPGAKLDVNGTLKIDTLAETVTNTDLQILLQDLDGIIRKDSVFTYNPAENLFKNGELQLFSGSYIRAVNDLTLGTNNAGAVITVKSITGNVGIGTTAPGQKLEINGGTNLGRIKVTGAGAGYTQADILLQTSASSDNPEIRGTGAYTFNEGTDVNWYFGNPYGGGGVGTDKFVINRKTGASFDITTAEVANSLVTILNSGNVGIGTTAPTQKLTVAGNINVVGGSFIDDGTTLNVPDYVFETGYELRTIPELEIYLAQNQHLPGVSSREQIKKNGMNYGSMIMSLLEKTEENTLYTIANYKDIQTNKTQITSITNNQNKIVEQLTGQLADQNLTVDNKLQLIGSSLSELTINQIKTIKDQITANTKDITDLKDQVKTLQDQTKSIIDFQLAFNLDKVIIKDALGNISLLDGKITAKDIEVLNKIKATDIEATNSLKGQNLELGTQVSGTSMIKAGELESIKILTTEAKAGVKIYITPLDKLSGRSLYIDREKIEEGVSFRVELDGEVLSNDINFNWLIVK